MDIYEVNIMRVTRTKQYMEERARQTLCQICGYDVEDLLCADKPDIQDKHGRCGIEVVQDIEEDDRQREAFIEQVWDRPYDEIDPKKIERFQSTGGKISKVADNRIRSAIIGEEKPNTPTHLIKTIKKKVDLLNKEIYKPFESYGLYVFVETVSIDEYFDSYVLSVIEAVSAYGQKMNFQKLFLDYDYGICVCDLLKKDFERISISHQIRDSIHKEIQKPWQY